MAGEASLDEDSTLLEALEQRGTLRRAMQPLPPDWLGRRPKVAVDMVRLLVDEREGRR